MTRDQIIVRGYIAGERWADLGSSATIVRALARAGVTPNRGRKLRLIKTPRCVVCGCDVPRHEMDTDRTWMAREVCSREHMRATKMTQADKGRLRWQEART
jgi:hypothetical protein